MWLKIIFILTLLTTQVTFCTGQIWPFTPMIRFGNTTYYDVDKLAGNDFELGRQLLGKSIVNSYVDTQLKTDSLTLNLNGELTTFHQDKSEHTKHNSHKLFYSRRPLINKKGGLTTAKIDYIKVINVTSDSLYIELTIRKINVGPKHSRQKIKSTIANSDLDGLFIGPGKQYRTWSSTLATVIVLGLIIIGE